MQFANHTVKACSLPLTTHRETSLLKATHLETSLLKASHRETSLLKASHRETSLLKAPHREISLLKVTHRETSLLKASHRETSLLKATHRETSLLKATHRETSLLKATHCETSLLKATHRENMQFAQHTEQCSRGELFRPDTASGSTGSRRQQTEEIRSQGMAPPRLSGALTFDGLLAHCSHNTRTSPLALLVSPPIILQRAATGAFHLPRLTQYKYSHRSAFMVMACVPSFHCGFLPSKPRPLINRAGDLLSLHFYNATGLAGHRLTACHSEHSLTAVHSEHGLTTHQSTVADRSSQSTRVDR